jgi:glutamate---cysteine ligase / carboxylate-amine ligase
VTAEPEFTLGIEEEYFLVDQATRDVVGDPPDGMLAEYEALLGGQVSPEFLRSQIEIGTRVCASLDEARADLRYLRSVIASVAGAHGLAPIAAGTHPFARWETQKTTERVRYQSLESDLQGVGRRLAICGMHVHIGIPDDELRIDLLNQAAYFLPHLLALSTSSPFWQGENTGLKSYRLAVFDEMPRTGTPERFASWGEYRRHVDILVGAGLIEDATKLWWDLRPSDRFPTLEMRVSDCCTTLEDTLSIAALFRCLLRMLWRLKRDNQRWRLYSRMLIDENRWRAQRYGFDQGLVDFGRGAILPYAQLLDEMLALVEPDARHFGCLDEVLHTREILTRGTSAHRQLASYCRALADGGSRADALAAVVDWLIEETARGLYALSPDCYVLVGGLLSLKVVRVFA